MALRLTLASLTAIALTGGVALPTVSRSDEPKCPLIVGVPGSAKATPIVSNGLTTLFSRDVEAYDITSADLASDGHYLKIVIRVVKLALSDPSSPDGLFWRFDFQPAQGPQLFVEAVSSNNSMWGQRQGVSAYVGYVDSTAHLIGYIDPPTMDLKHNEVQFKLPLSDFGAQRPSTGSQLTGLQASGGRWYDIPLFTIGETDDTATTNRTVVLGRPTCIKV